MGIEYSNNDNLYGSEYVSPYDEPVVIQDIEEYRQAAGGRHRNIPQENKVICTIIFIAVNVLVYLACIGKENYTETGGLNYQHVVENHEYGRFLSSMFLHAGFEHILMNMAALWIFGKTVEKYVGSLKMTLIYVASGIGGGICSIYAHHIFKPETMTYSVGASGAIYGIIAAAIIIGAVKMGISSSKSILFVIVYFAFDIISTASKGGNIDIYAHAGGAVIGALLTAILLFVFKSDKMENVFSKILGIIIAVSISIIAVGNAHIGGTVTYLPSEKIQFVKACSTKAAPDITFGDSFEEYFTSPTWTCYTSTDNEDIVEFTGTYSYNGQSIPTKLEFTVDIENNSSTIKGLYYNDAEQSDEELYYLFKDIFETYGNRHGISVEF
jgi:rhomboid protease GluP